jgi:hypothetical protein
MMCLHPVRESSRREIIGCVAANLTTAHWLVGRLFSFFVWTSRWKFMLDPVDGVELWIDA